GKRDPASLEKQFGQDADSMRNSEVAIEPVEKDVDILTVGRSVEGPVKKEVRRVERLVLASQHRGEIVQGADVSRFNKFRFDSTAVENGVNVRGFVALRHIAKNSGKRMELAAGIFRQYLPGRAKNRGRIQTATEQ